MSTEFEVTETLDVQGESCPMPVVKTRGAVDGLASGDVLEVLATDSGSVSDIAGWADTVDDVELLDQTDDGSVYSHYLRKV
jgi:TusA-related sulfurtransferase